MERLKYLLLVLIGCMSVSLIQAKVFQKKSQIVTFSVLQFNIWNEGNRISNSYNAIVDEIARTQADFITLSEVRNYQGNFTQKLCKSLEEKTGDKYYSFCSNDCGLISKHQIGNTKTIFPLNNDRGSVYKAMTSIGGRRVALYTAHLDYTHYACFYPRGYDGNTWQKMDEIITDLDKIKQDNLASQRDEQIKAFIADAKAEIERGSLIFLGGDFNEPSLLDWTEALKNLYDHNGVVYEWDQSKSLLDAGFKDAYREIYPDPTRFPGFTYPSDNEDVDISTLTWAPDADERERIDYIYYYPHSDLTVKDATLVGPLGTIAKSQRIPETGEDKHLTPLHVWPSDHKALLVEFKLENADPSAPDLVYPQDTTNSDIVVSSSEKKVCYRIKDCQSGLYAVRDYWKNNIKLLSVEDAVITPSAYWWFEDGDFKDDQYIIRNLATKDNFNLYALDNNFKDNDGTEWFIRKEDNGTYVIGYGDNDNYNWTATPNGIVNKKEASEQINSYWILEKIDSCEIPVRGIKVSTEKQKYYYTLLNQQSKRFMARAPENAKNHSTMNILNKKEKYFYWYFEIAGKDNAFYIRNAAYPDLYFCADEKNSFSTTPTAWIIEPSSVTEAGADLSTMINHYCFKKANDKTKYLSYVSDLDGSELTLWEGSSTNKCDTWTIQEELVPVTMQPISGEMVKNAPGKYISTFSAPYAVELPDNLKCFYIDNIQNGVAYLQPIDKHIPENAGVILISDKPGIHLLSYIPKEGSFIQDNLLTSNCEKDSILKNGEYILKEINKVTQFYPIDEDFICKKNKAFIGSDVTNGELSISLDFNAIETSIDDITPFKKTDTFYDLNGYPILNPVDGHIYIKDNKTILYYK